MSTYPDAEDYVRAVQDPATAFRTPQLRGARFELHPRYGIPMPASGNAAVVFRAGVGGKDTALRFFLREDASSRERYTALGRHFTTSGLEDCVAHPTWLDDAITVNGGRWPVVQMSWVDGRTLDAYVGHLAGTGDVGALSTLAGAWREFVGRLQGAGFAHGDLQHGNVLVDTTSTLRLVDFDGSWIAAFAGGPPPRETGHPNYQRTGREWGRWMDTFPALVIYTSLLALARRPAAWSDLHTGENILFSAADFEPPFRTPAWTLLAGLRDPAVDAAAATLMRACDPGWEATGPLESVLTAPAPRPRPATTGYTGVTLPTGHWWDQPAAGDTAMPPPPPKEPASTETGSFAGVGEDTSWYAAPPPPRPAPPPPVPPRPVPVLVALLLAVLAAVVGGSVVSGAGGGDGAATVAAAVAAVAVAVPLLRRRR
jgi:hypothetical protein